jgi:predicted DsbA family dithiol-disulfide isomerase
MWAQGDVFTERANFPSMKKLLVQVWSDVACPWCYIGKRRLEGALLRFEHCDDVTVQWRAFELDPSAPRVPLESGAYAARLARKYGFSVSEAEKKLASMTELAASEGLDFRFDRIRSSNTFDAHRLIHLAAERGVQGAMKERLLSAYFTEGTAMSDREALVRLAGECGLDVDEAQSALAGDTHERDVRADEETAREAGIHGVPFFLVGRYAVSGAQPADLLLRALGKAWEELPAEAPAEGAACGPDGCGI